MACWFGYQQLKSEFQRPQALLVLGGAIEREVFAAKFALNYPELPIWVSSGSNPEFAQWVFSEAGIESDRVHLDYRAVDTVTNFTTLVDELKAQGIESVYLITSDDHMRRVRLSVKSCSAVEALVLSLWQFRLGEPPNRWKKLFATALELFFG